MRCDPALDLDHGSSERIKNSHGQSSPGQACETSLNPALCLRSTLAFRSAKSGHIRKAKEHAPRCAPRSAVSAPCDQNKAKPTKLPTRAAANSTFIGAPTPYYIYILMRIITWIVNSVSWPKPLLSTKGQVTMLFGNRNKKSRAQFL